MEGSIKYVSKILKKNNEYKIYNTEAPVEVEPPIIVYSLACTINDGIRKELNCEVNIYSHDLSETLEMSKTIEENLIGNPLGFDSESSYRIFNIKTNDDIWVESKSVYLKQINFIIIKI